MKKVLVLILSCLLVLGACGQDEDKNKEDDAKKVEVKKKEENKKINKVNLKNKNKKNLITMMTNQF